MSVSSGLALAVAENWNARRWCTAGRRLSSSALPLRTIESGPPALHDTLDAGCAIATGTRLALAVVNGPGVLEPTRLARCLHIVARRRTTRRDRTRQHVLDGGDEAL